MTKYSGSALYAQMGTVNISANIRNFEVALAQESADATAGADPYRNFVPTVKTIEVTFEYLPHTHSTGGSAINAVLTHGFEGTFLYGEEGSATGKPKGGFYARVKQNDKGIPFDDVVTRAITLELAGTDLLFNHQTDLW